MRSYQLASNDATTTDSVHKSKGNIVVCLCVPVNRCCEVCVSVLQRGQYGKVCVFASTLCKYDFIKVDSFVLSWARV